jgi:hypothetical protein
MRIPTSRNALVTYGCILLLTIGYVAARTRAQDDYTSWAQAQIQSWDREMSENSARYTELQPRMLRERTRCEVAQDLERQMTQLNVRNNELRRLKATLEGISKAKGAADPQ